MIRRSIHNAILGALVLCLTASTLFAQTERGAIVGTVTDSQGAVVSSATVTVTSLATNVSQTYKTNSEGLYEAPFLTPGEYKVAATASGFSTSFNNKTLTELPSGDRNIYSFILPSSNVTQPPGGNAPAFRLESGGSFSISGTRPSSVTFKVDGLSNTDPAFGTPTITPSLDSVQEFNMQSNAYSAK